MHSGQELEIEFGPPQKRRIELMAAHRGALLEQVRQTGPEVFVALVRKR